MQDLATAYGPVLDPFDLTSCDREPIHVPGAIQPHGALLALDPRNLRIVHAGGDTVGLLGAPAAALPGRSATSVIPIEQAGQLRDPTDRPGSITRPLHAFAMAGPGGAVIDVVAHRSAELLVLEFEPQREPPPENPLALVQTMVRNVQPAQTVPAFCQALATEVRAVTGFDRVMIYRFMPDGSGAVTAEATDDGVESFLGLHYPSSDIPTQARALYRANLIRMIPDARYAPSPIIPTVSPADGRALDLSQSTLRSVATVHRQYLANMGVVASMSLSLVVGGQLWGLIACHHGAPRHLPYGLREACALFAEMAAAQLEARLAAERFEAQQRFTRIHEELVARMSRELDLADGLIRARPNLLDLIPAAGVGLWIEGRCASLGIAPPADAIAALVAWLNATVSDGVFSTDCLSRLHPPAAGFADTASGLLAVSVSKSPRDYVLWFRPELIRTVTWAGNPDKPVRSGTGSLTPRNSFAAWRESVRLHSSPWLVAEVEAAHRLRLSLLEVVLRRIDEIARERETARLRQEQLNRELDTKAEQWRSVAEALKQETERRAVVEAELSQVLHRTVTDQEAERLRIARELHDTLGQSLTLLKLGLDGIEQVSRDSPEVQQRVAGMKGLAADVGREVNRLAWEIRPTALDDLGIETAIRNLMESWSERSSVQFDLHLTLENRRLPAAVETTLYRVLQEALTNVVRHAGAKRVGVILGLADQRLTMIVEDDGRGFDWNEVVTATPTSRRLGLLGIRERLALVGGAIEVESAPGRGTTLFVRVPLP